MLHDSGESTHTDDSGSRTGEFTFSLGDTNKDAEVVEERHVKRTTKKTTGLDLGSTGSQVESGTYRNYGYHDDESTL